MSNKHGDFIWYELMTRDPTRAKSFYEDVVGWTISAEPPGDADYQLIGFGGDFVGGVLRLTEQMCDGGARPGWMGYVGVDDVDATVARLQTLDGKVLMPPRDLTGVGRFAMVADPQGIPFYVMRGAVEDGQSNAFKPMALGHCSWNELATVDQAGALSFYGELFGWESKESMPMGDMGEYKFIHQNGEMIGAVSPCADPSQGQGWTYYFHVSDVDAVMEKTQAHGGKVLLEPHEVPGGDYIVIGADPEGAVFAVVGPRGR
ncbi:VOC family protein [Gilvimarinus sp. F26214L]|uniref:VOC family protein n=1 Tax=Gilvimarinus sp. DZF01 TaxID=3461371 RepID=UPI004045F9D9